MSSLEERLGYAFRAPRLRDQALTHRSFRHENPGAVDDGEAAVPGDNERLEFLGDAVLGFLVSRMLYGRFPERTEGQLSQSRAMVVSAQHLAEKARALGLGDALRLGRGEEMTNGRDKDSILANAYESLIAALFLDGGLAVAERFVEQAFAPDLEQMSDCAPRRDYKSHLQEVLHARGVTEPAYRVVAEEGPDHDKLFEVVVTVGGEPLARGLGRSKKAAQQEAARLALERLGMGPDGAAAAPGE